MVQLWFPRSILRWAACAVLLAAVTAGPAAAEQAFSFGATPGTLPKTVTPVHYAIELVPDLDKLTFSGSELIDIDVAEPVERLTLNALGLTIESAAVDGEAAAAIDFQPARQTVTFGFPHPIAAGRHQLRVAFAGRIYSFGRGLFYVDHLAAEGRKRMITSHLEPADARRIFPGWDEPAFKASFALTVTVPQAFLAVSNMPIASEETAGDGRRRVAFQPTPRMSTYLFTITAGDLERVTMDVDGVTVGLVTTRGKAGRGGFALDTARDVLRYFNDYFGTPYPLPKLDLIAVPGGQDRAMENWGGITFYESRLLLDPAGINPAKGADTARRVIFTFVAHEIAHQWFGDLVTMAWWDNVWLNEGFATWMEGKAAEVLHPDWQVSIDGSLGFRQKALSLDAGRSAHPIQRPVANEAQAMAAFDAITYGKGQAVIRMLEDYVGEDGFRAGIRTYINRHAYSNTTTADLWEALEAASDKPVTAVASGFTEQGGIPLVIAHASCSGDAQRVALRQERFIISETAEKDQPAETPQQRWKVPVTRGGVGGAREILLLDGTAEFAAGHCGDPVKLNFGAMGYYRVQYDGAMLAALARVVDRLPAADRANLAGDTWALVEAGRVPVAAFLELAERLKGDDNRAVVETIVRAMTRIDRLQQDRTERAPFRAFGRSLLQPLFNRIGWDALPQEPTDYAHYRVQLIAALGDFDDEAVVAEAKRRFADFVRDPATLPAALHETVTGLAGRTADHTTYDTLMRLARAAGPGDRARYYIAAASARDPDLARETLALTLTDDVPATLVGRVISTIAGTGGHRDLAWTFVKANFAKLAARQGPSFQDNVPAGLLANFADTAHAQELAGFSPAHVTSDGRSAAARAYQSILKDVDFSAQQLPAADAWVKGWMDRL
jgi:aminopeptidase N